LPGVELTALRASRGAPNLRASAFRFKGRQSEARDGIAERDVFAHTVRERYFVQELPRFLRRLERVVGGEHHVVGSKCGERAVQRLGRAHSGRRHHHILLDVVRRPLLEGDTVELGAAVETPQQVRECLAEMPKGDPRPREAIEHTAKDQAQGMRAGLKAPFPGGAPQAVMAVERRRGRDRVRRMNVDRRLQRLGPFPERVQLRVIEILAVGVAVDHRPAKLQLAQAACSSSSAAARGSCMAICAKPE
jgi:hypothetical protein